MFSLIKSDDAKILSNSRFTKNAIFYKDMFAFFDAYEKFTTDYKNDLPNFCFVKKQLCLDGLCLAMKMYASELGFETLRLSAEYLKVVYYAIASYSKDEKTVDRQDIEIEYAEYKKASRQIVLEAESNISKVEKVYEEKKQAHDKGSNKYAQKLIASQLYNVFSVMFFILGLAGVVLTISLYMIKVFDLKMAIIVGASALIVLESLSGLFKYLSNKAEEQSHDNAYLLQNLKKEKDIAYQELKKEKDKVNKIISERYEFLHSFSNSFEKFYEKLDYAGIVEKLAEYKLLSYNIKEDVKRLFQNQQKDISEIVSEIASLTKKSSNDDFAYIYNEIKSQDWLYYNLEIRYNFLKKFIDVCERTHKWGLVMADSHISPFGVDVKALAKEQIAYLKSKDGLFVSTTLDRFLNTKYAKNLEELELKGRSTADAIKNVKAVYINHFYNYDKIKEYDNLFYATKLEEGVKISEEILDENEKIPTFVLMKIKILENSIGLGNSESFAVKQIANEIALKLGEELIEMETIEIAEADIIRPIYECEKIEEVNEYTVRYVFGDNVVTGYKLIES